MIAPAKVYKAPALEKGLDILELLAQTSKPLTQNEIAKSLGRSVSEIFRMLSCLLQRGYVVQAADAEGFELSLKLFELSHKHAPINRLLSVASPVMKMLAQECDQSCHLAVYNNGHVMVVLQEDNPGAIGFSVRVGTLIDLLKSASGPVLYTFSSPEIRAEMLLFHGQSHDPDAAALKTLQQSESRILTEKIYGHASSQVAGIYDYSCPVLDYKNQILAVLSVPYVRRLDIDQNKEIELPMQLKRAALLISEKIAYS